MREKMSKQPPPAPTASATGPCPTIIQISRTPQHWKFTQHLRISRRALNDAKTAIAGKPVPRLLASSGSSTPHLITVLSSALAGQKSVQTSCMRRHSSIVSVSSSTVAARHNKSSRRGFNSLRAFLCPSDRSDFLELFPEFVPCFAMYERFVNNVVDFVINPAEIKKWSGGGDCADDTGPHKTRTERIFSFSNKSRRNIVYDVVVCPEHVVLYLKALDITRMHALH